MLNGKKAVIGIICIVVISVGIWGGKYLFDVKKYESIVKDIKIENVDLSKVSDGKYSGYFDAIIVSAKVDVTVNDHKITDIVLVEHKNERGKSAEVLPAEVMKFQSLKVDTISGATSSSNVILKSIENALNSNKE